MKNKNKIIFSISLWITIVVIIWLIFYNEYNKKNYSDNVKSLYLNNGNNEIKDIPSQIDE